VAEELDPFGPRPPGGWRCPTCGRSCQMAGARFPDGLSVRVVICRRCGHRDSWQQDANGQRRRESHVPGRPGGLPLSEN